MEKKSTKLRKLLESREMFPVIGVGTAHQAQLVEKIGFKALVISGSDTSTDILGYPDAGFLTLTELVENTERICRAVNIPAYVDCDTGFGNAVNVIRTTELVIRAGAAGLFIEDQVAPKRCGFVKGKEIVPLEEAVGKYRAALDVRDELDPDFIIIARTDARGAVGGSLEEVIRRGRAYLSAGVDVFYAEALLSRDEIRNVSEALRKDLEGRWFKVTSKMIKPPLSQKERQEFQLCMPSCHISQIGSIAMYDFLINLKTQGLDYYTDHIKKTNNHPVGGMGGVYELSGFSKVVEWEKKYLPPERLDSYDKSIGLYDPRAGHQRKK